MRGIKGDSKNTVMSLYQDITSISVQGTTENIIRMLNAVICAVGDGNIINDGDDLDTINNKLKAEDGHGFRIALPDLLDERCQKDTRLLEKKRAYEKKLKEKEAYEAGEQDFWFESQEEEYEYFKEVDSDIWCNERMIDILKVFRYRGGLDIEFQMYECEGCPYYRDWLGWEDIALVYDCLILVDNDLYRNGELEEFCGTSVYESDDDTVKTSRIEPKLDIDSFVNDFDKLIEICPDRGYRPMKIARMKAAIKELQYYIDKEEELQRDYEKEI